MANQRMVILMMAMEVLILETPVQTMEIQIQIPLTQQLQ
jgi:hypothetical protein